MLHGSSAFEDDSCYRKIADGSAQLEHCAPNPSRLMESIADVISAQKSGSLAETWLRLGIRMHDIVSQAPEGSRGGWTERLSASECKTTVSNPQWAGALELSARAVQTGLRLLADPSEAPQPGTHAGLSMGRVLLHPCASAAVLKHTHNRGFYSHVRKYSMSGNTGLGEDSGLLQEAQAARERGACEEAVSKIHLAAKAAPDSVLVWYNLQITMMECGLWDFSFSAPDPLQLLAAAPTSHPQYPGDCASNFSIVTAASYQYFDRLRNLVGSVHFWEPEMSVLVYDVGLTTEQASEARTWEGVQFETLTMEAMPEHVTWTGWEASSYAFKPVVLWQALQQHRCVLWMDSGLELRQPLRWAPRWLQAEGALLVGSGWPFPNSWVHPGTLRAHGIAGPFELLDAKGQARVEVWSGLMGFNREDREMMTKVVEPMYQCALDRACIAPIGSNKSNHRQDQTVLSVLLLRDEHLRASRHIFTSSKLRAFAPSHLSRITEDETKINDILIFQRRGHKPFPYHKHLRRRR